MANPIENHIELTWQPTYYNAVLQRRRKWRWGPWTEIWLCGGCLRNMLVAGFLGHTRIQAFALARKWSRRYGRLPIVDRDRNDTEIWLRHGRKLKEVPSRVKS